MSLLNLVQTGKIARPILLMLYGVEGIGKSTFASKAPKPIFIGAEQGTDVLDISRFPLIKDWDDLNKYLDTLLNEEHQYQTVVIDTIDSLEPILWDKVKKESNVNSIELACGGYGKGYVKAAEEFLKLRYKLDKLRTKGMNVIILAHSQIAKFSDPITNIEYDTYRLKVHKRVSPIFIEWVDALLFANYMTYAKKGQNKQSIFGDGSRVLYTEKRPSFDAKNRFSLPFELELDYQKFVGYLAAFYQDNKIEDNSKCLQKIILEKLKLITEPELVKKVTSALNEAGSDTQRLQAILDRLNILIGG